jgi:hypothetical protein
MKRILLLAILLPAPLFAQNTADTSYNYFDFNYFGTNWPFGPSSIDGSGYSARFSVALRDHLFLTGEYGAWDFDTIPRGSTTTSVGFGSNWEFGEKWSVFGLAGFRSIDLDLGLGNQEQENGYIGGGARWQIADGYELRFAADFADLTPARRGKSSVTVGGDIFLTEVVAISLDANVNDDEATIFSIGLRFYHDRTSDNLRQRR